MMENELFYQFAYVFYLVIGWLCLSCGLTFVIAAAFFGFKEQKNFERDDNEKNFKRS
jgi:hypothetical protein